MRYENAVPLLREGKKLIKQRSERDGIEWNYEMLFHPGNITDSKDLESVTIGKDKSFFVSQDRVRDYEALHKLKSIN